MAARKSNFWQSRAGRTISAGLKAESAREKAAVSSNYARLFPKAGRARAARDARAAAAATKEYQRLTSKKGGGGTTRAFAKGGGARMKFRTGPKMFGGTGTTSGAKNATRITMGEAARRAAQGARTGLGTKGGLGATRGARIGGAPGSSRQPTRAVTRKPKGKYHGSQKTYSDHHASSSTARGCRESRDGPGRPWWLGNESRYRSERCAHFHPSSSNEG